MANLTYKSGSEGLYLEEKYLTYGEVGLPDPALLPGTLWAWGNNTGGRLGDGTTTHRSSPIQIAKLTSWKLLSDCGSSTSAIKTDGTLWTWGQNTDGELGDGTVTHRSSPVQIGSLTNWQLVTVGDRFIAAIKTDGTLWVWGNNDYGRLGDGTVTHRSSPVQIGSLTNWKEVDVSLDHTMAIKTDGTLWAWGRGGDGNLGDGTTTFRSSPVQIGALTDWKQVSAGFIATAAIKTDGTLWTWGYNSFRGGLGDGTRVSKSSPIQIGTLTNWKQVSAGWYFMSAIKTDGTLWSWGENSYGKLGDGTTTHRSSPVQIGALTNWKQVSAGTGSQTAAIKTDGTLWTWGFNDTGQLGDGTLTRKSSPIQVGSLTNWQIVNCGVSHVVAQTYTYS